MMITLKLTDFINSRLHLNILLDNDGKLKFRDTVTSSSSTKDLHRAIPVFDRSADNLIEQKEFTETFTSRNSRPRTEEELIMDEVSQLVSLCRCVSKYKVYHVGDSKYRVSTADRLSGGL